MAISIKPLIGLMWLATSDPTIAPGAAAPLDNLLIRTDTNSLYYKSGALNTDWILIAGGGFTGMSIGGGVTGGTTGSVLFIGTGPVLAQDNAGLFFDPATNRLGVNTNAPGSELDVNGTITGVTINGTTINATTGGITTVNATTINSTSVALAATGFLSAANGSAAAVSGANTGRLRYNTTGQVFQVSLNGAAYVNVVTGTGVGMAIGNTIGNSPTDGSLLFVGTSGVLAQSVATTTRYVSATNNLQIGADAVTNNNTAVPLAVSASSTENISYMWNTNTAGYSALGFLNTARVFQCSIGFGNSAVASPLTSRGFISVGSATDFVMIDSSNDLFFFRMNSSSSNRGRLGIYPSNVTPRTDPSDFIDIIHNTNDGVTGGLRTQNNNTTGGRVNGLSACDQTGTVRALYGVIQDGSNPIGFVRGAGATPGILAWSGGADICWIFQNQSTSGYSGAGFAGGTGLPASVTASIGVGQSAAGITDFRATPFLFCGSGADWVIGNATGALIRWGTVNNAAFAQYANGSSAAVSAANTGRLRYNTTGHVFQVSLNGAAYSTLAIGGGTGMVIGNTITSATAGSVLYAGAAGVLAQDNAGLFFDAASDLLGVGTNTPNAPLDVENNNAGGHIIRACNLSDSGFASLNVANEAGVTQGHLGFANGTVASTAYRDKLYWMVVDASATINFGDATSVAHEFGCIDGSAYHELNDGAAAGLSAAGNARLRYNAGTDKLQVSKNGAAYVDIV